MKLLYTDGDTDINRFDLISTVHNPVLSTFTDVIYSTIGSLVWLIAIVTWVTIFQLNRASWGEFADRISFIIPLGTP